MIPKIMRSPDPIDYLTTDVELTSVANAIRAKGNTNTPLEYPDEFITAIQNIPAPGVIQEDGQGNITLPETGDALVISQLTVTENGTYTASETAGYNPVIVSVDVQDAEEKDVNFIDYDGTIVYSYTVDEFNELTEMPANPTHSGLTAEGWNWTLSDAKTYLQTCKYLVIGQNYITAPDEFQRSVTRIYIELQEGYLSPYLGLAVNGTAYVNWGDHPYNEWYSITGTSWYDVSDLISTQHTYAAPGRYCISINATGPTNFIGYSATIGSTILWAKNTTNAAANKPYQSSILKIEFGTYTHFDQYAFTNCYRLSTISFTKFSANNISYQSGAFNNCYSLKSITGPIRKAQGCYSLKNVALPKNSYIMDESSTFSYCYCLSSIAINSITEIKQGAFSYCKVLSKIYIPSTVTNIVNGAFGYCTSLRQIYFTRSTPPTIANSTAFSDLPTDCVIFVPGDSGSIMQNYFFGTNYPSYSTYKYVGYATYSNGASLPSSYSGQLTFHWYATKQEAINDNGTQLSTGTGNEVYCRILELF